MAIVLKVEEYCHDCRYFEPTLDDYVGMFVKDKLVTCENQYKCLHASNSVKNRGEED